MSGVISAPPVFTSFRHHYLPVARRTPTLAARGVAEHGSAVGSRSHRAKSGRGVLCPVRALHLRTHMPGRGCECPCVLTCVQNRPPVHEEKDGDEDRGSSIMRLMINAERCAWWVDVDGEEDTCVGSSRLPPPFPRASHRFADRRQTVWRELRRPHRVCIIQLVVPIVPPANSNHRPVAEEMTAWERGRGGEG